MVERLLSMQEVPGSIPGISIFFVAPIKFRCTFMKPTHFWTRLWSTRAGLRTTSTATKRHKKQRSLQGCICDLKCPVCDLSLSLDSPHLRPIKMGCCESRSRQSRPNCELERLPPIPSQGPCKFILKPNSAGQVLHFPIAFGDHLVPRTHNVRPPRMQRSAVLRSWCRTSRARTGCTLRRPPLSRRQV